MKSSMEYESSGARIKNCALDFLYLGYDITDDDDYNDDDDKQESSWVVMEGDVVLKSTFMYCDFCRMIKAAPPHERHHLTTLASTLLSSFEQVLKLSDLICIYPIDIYMTDPIQ
ncbi:hypothetical protein Dimus_009978 [Dionaea muscipula]